MGRREDRELGSWGAGSWGAFSFKPNLGIAYYNYGLVLSELGELPDPRAAFKTAIDLS